MSLTNDTGTTMLVQPATTGYGNSGFGNMFGDGSWWIILFLIFGMFGGGWGFGNGGFGGGMNGGVGSEVQRGFDHSSIVTKLDGITNGLSDGFYTVNSNLSNGFHGVDNAICNLGYQTQQGFNQTNIALMQGQNALATQLANCCCENREAIANVRYDLATQSCDTRNTIQNTTRDILENQNSGVQAILGKLSQMEYNDLNSKYQAALTENQSLKFQASQTAQNGFIDAVGNSIVAQLRQPTPVPAYTVPNPYASYGYGCGCNTCGC